MFVSSGQGPTFMADRDSHCSQLPSNQVGSSEYHDDSSQAMPHIFFASCTCSDLVYAALQAICTKVSKAPVMWLSFEEGLGPSGSANQRYHGLPHRTIKLIDAELFHFNLTARLQS
jgi:hypothetical protein